MLYLKTVLTSLAEQMLNSVNQHRKGCELPELEKHDALQRASDYQANVLCYLGKLTHEGMDRDHTNLDDRLRAYDFVGENIGENIAKQEDDNYEEVLKLWIDSEKHRRNIYGDYNFTGLSSCKDKKGNRFWVQVFGKGKKRDMDQLKSFINEVQRLLNSNPNVNKESKSINDPKDIFNLILDQSKKENQKNINKPNDLEKESKPIESQKNNLSENDSQKNNKENQNFNDLFDNQKNTFNSLQSNDNSLINQNKTDQSKENNTPMNLDVRFKNDLQEKDNKTNLSQSFTDDKPNKENNTSKNFDIRSKNDPQQNKNRKDECLNSFTDDKSSKNDKENNIPKNFDPRSKNDPQQNKDKTDDSDFPQSLKEKICNFIFKTIKEYLNKEKDIQWKDDLPSEKINKKNKVEIDEPVSLGSQFNKKN